MVDFKRLMNISKAAKEAIAEEEKYRTLLSPEERRTAELFFQIGSIWQKEQMMKDAIDAEVKEEYYNPNLPLYIDTIYVDDRADLKRGDKVKLIIIKETEQ